MPLVFHELGHSPDGAKAGASVDAILREGLLSKALLKKHGKLPMEPNPYEQALALNASQRDAHLQQYEAWVSERKEALKDDQPLLERVLQKNSAEAFLQARDETRHQLFFEPGFAGHREEHIFFRYHDHPPASRDWVAVEVPHDAVLYNESFRDSNQPKAYENHPLTIQEYQEQAAEGSIFRHGWKSLANEHLIRDTVPSERIVAYAKVEKELPHDPSIGSSNAKNIKKFLNEHLSFATHFDHEDDNVLLAKENGKQQIRVSFNVEKIKGREHEVRTLFDRFSSMREIAEAANQNVRTQECALIDDTPAQFEQLTGSHPQAPPSHQSQQRQNRSMWQALRSCIPSKRDTKSQRNLGR